MKKPNITEGEWRYVETPHIQNGDLYSISVGFLMKDIVINIGGGSTKKHLDEQRANAQAISAVPEMLDALITLVERIEYYASFEEPEVNIEDWAYTEGSDDFKKAKEALKKAGCTE